MTTRVPSMCDSCIHFNTWSLGLDGTGAPTCAAYPDRIPDRYWSGGLSHTDPDGTDSGITYEMRPGRDSTLESYVKFWYEPEDREDPEDPDKFYL